MPDQTSDPQTEQQATEQPEAVEEQEAVEAETAETAASEEKTPEVETPDEASPPPEETETATAEEAESGEEIAASDEETPDETDSPPEETETATAEEAESGEETAASDEETPDETGSPPEETEMVADEEAEQEEETLPAGPSFGERLGTAFAAFREKLGVALGPTGEKLSAAFAPLRERLGPVARTYGVYILIALLVIAALFLPPISLLQRLGIVGYTAINAENNAVSHPDGITMRVDPETFTGKLRVRLDSVPRENFEGFAHSPLRDAAEALLGDYSHLQAKSPLFQIKVRGNPDQPVMLDVDMPANAEPWETLDLYTWTGETWEWVGSELHTETAEQEFIRAWVTDIPANLIVMQVGPSTTTISAYLEQGENPQAAANALDEINPAGLMLSTGGSLAGDPNSLPQPVAGAAYAVLPTLRNWTPGQAIVLGPLSDVLERPDDQEAHIASIVQQLCTERGFAGVDVDYRGVTPDNRDAYSAFIGALADALHAQGLRLTVAVQPPTPTDGEWDTGGYDWRALGAVADAVKVPFPEEPAAYTAGGRAQRLLDWAKARVPRHKLHMLVSSLSADQSAGGVNFVSMEQALAPFGEAVALYSITQIEPNGQVEFGLSGSLMSITHQEAAGTYQMEYKSDSGETHTVWLGTATNLAAKLRWAQRYHLGGIAVADMLNPGNAAGIIDTVASYRTTVASPTEQKADVVWTVSSAGATVNQQNSPLTDPGYTWAAEVAAGTYTIDASVAGFGHGSVTITVAEPTPEPTPEPAPEPVAEPLETECLKASFADETVPDGTHFDKNEDFAKSWTMLNSGTCDWPAGTALVKINSQTGGPESVPVGAVAVGETVDIKVDMTAPDSDGTFDGLWALKIGDTDIPGGRVTVVIQVGEGGGIAVTTVTPVSGGSFELGGHVRDTGFPYADKMHYAGMNWAKVQVHYGQDASGIIEVSHARGFKIQLSALGSPDMVTQPGFESDFASWVAAMAAQGADAIEIWNEPNIDREWKGERINPQAYTNLLCASYSAIKAANGNTIVISAAPSPTGWFSQAGGAKTSNCDDGIGCGYDDQPWMAGLRDAGAVNCMDYIGAHHNSGATAPSARSGHPADPGSTHHSWFFLPQTELYYNTFGGARKLFYTEMGYASQEGLAQFSDAFAWARGTNNAQQAAWLAEAVQLSASTGMVRCIIVWNIDYVRYGYDPQDGFAIIRPGGSCPACDSLHNVLGTR